MKLNRLIAGCFLIALTSCATTTPQSKFTATSVEQIKTGMPKSEVVGILGEPRSRLTDNNSNDVWQYRKNGQQGKAVKTYSNIMSFGLTSGLDAEYQDILTVTFKSNLVSKTTYQENVRSTLTQP